MRFVIDGWIKPYVRMTQRGKWKSRDAQEYLTNKAAISWQLKCQMADAWVIWPEGTPLAVTLRFEIPRKLHYCDLDNLVKAVLDAAQTVLFADDRYVDRIRASRIEADKWRTVMEVWSIRES